MCQGDVIRDVEMIEHATQKAGVLEVSKVVFPLAIILTQDCDLEQDHKFRNGEESSQDKWLISILVAPIYNVEHVYQGEHLSDLKMTMEPISKKKTPGAYLVQNQRPRYHYLSFPSDVSIADSVIDFKHYFSVNGATLSTLHKSQFVCRLDSLYREEVSQRFCSFLGRIGLPT